MKKFVQDLLNSESVTSARRFITLIVSVHFIVTSFLVSFFVFYLILYIPRGTVNPALIDLLKVIFDYDFYIILSGLGLITAQSLGNILLEKMKVKAAANIQTGTPTTDVINVENVNVDQTSLKTGVKNEAKKEITIKEE